MIISGTRASKKSLEVFEFPSELYGPFMQSHLFAAEEASFMSRKNDGPEAQGPWFRRLLAEVYQEWKIDVTMTKSPVLLLVESQLNRGRPARTCSSGLEVTAKREKQAKHTRPGG